MSINVNHSRAEAKLKIALTENCQGSNSFNFDVRKIILGDHKTYRYILVTGLLAKATDNRVNPLALQAKSTLQGAYDARSLCHKVLVPFEREYLHNALGGSNEPFLNKPARFPELSKNNAVRAGKDRDTLFSLIRVLGNIGSSEMAFGLLACALDALREEAEERKKLEVIAEPFSSSVGKAYELLMEFASESNQGESMVMVIGCLETLAATSNGMNVKVHNVNQSGASSREIGDIDVSLNNTIQYSIEVKDKAFNRQDVEHAFSKMSESNCHGGLFISRSEYVNEANISDEQLRMIGREDFLAMIVNFDTYVKMQLLKFVNIDEQDLFQGLLNVAHSANLSRHSVRRVHALASSQSW